MQKATSILKHITFAIQFLVLLLLSSNSSADILEPLPVCSPGVATAQQWDSITNTQVTNSVWDGNVNFGETYNVGKGLMFGCASQLRMRLKQVFVTGGSYWTSDALEALPGVTSSVTVVDAGQGDGVIVGLTFAAPSTTFWPECFPGSSFSSDPLCSEGNYPPTSTGVMAYRFRDNNGAFTGKWTISGTRDYVPGFVIRRITECPPNSQYCPYEVIFRRNPNGTPSFNRDAQVILQMSVNLPITETGGAFNSKLAIPLFIRQSNYGTTNNVPTATPTSTPTTTSTPRNCVVPSVVGQKLDAATRLIKKQGCAIGRVTRIKSRKMAKGKVISTSIRARAVKKLGTKINLVVSKG